MGNNLDGRTDTPGTPEDWVWARELYDKDDTIELPVIGYNRGGLLVEARGLRGFIPISHLVDVTKKVNVVECITHQESRH